MEPARYGMDKVRQKGEVKNGRVRAGLKPVHARRIASLSNMLPNRREKYQYYLRILYNTEQQVDY